MSVRHEQGKACPLCSEKITGGHPILQNLWKTIKTEFPNAHLSWVWRGKEDQNRFKDEGSSRLVWPDSPHNALLNGRAYSRAMDLFMLRTDGLAVWPVQWLEEISDYLKAIKAPIVWGGDWARFKDYPHFQLAESVKQE